MTTAPPLTPGPDLRGLLVDDRYQLVEPLAWGGMATVYVALDLKLRRRVAVKVIHPEHARTSTQRRRLLQEALIGAKIDHPNVVPVLDVGDVPGPGWAGERLLFLVMPLIRGQTLRSAILDGSMPWTRAVDLSGQLLAGLAAIHRVGALHRDIKPENCIVDRHDDIERLRLADLGLAKVVVAEGPLTHPPVSLAGTLVGTLTYLSPEQALGLPLDERADLYAVGVVLYELLTRRPPFVGKHLDLLNAHVAEAPMSPRALAPAAEIPAAVEATVLRALAKKPDDRFATAEAFAAALADARASPGATTTAAPGHVGCLAARASLAAWTRMEFLLAHEESARAARQDPGWMPLKVLMSCLPE
ncbi:MAG TPA: serine/threonine-protein kinase [Nannocystaceae bacterium]|nr:serine/threonine-protein kinase [Nannocystaceae bacterium]